MITAYLVDANNEIIGSMSLNGDDSHRQLEIILINNPWLISFEQSALEPTKWIVGFCVCGRSARSPIPTVSYAFEERRDNSFVLPQELRMAQLLGAEL